MTTLEIVELDAFDDAAVDAWHAAYLEAELAVGPGVTSPWQLEEMRAVLQHPGSASRQLGWSGTVDGEVVNHLAIPLIADGQVHDVQIEIGVS